MLGPILSIFKFMSMQLEKHHLPSWSNKRSLLSPHTIQFGSSWLEFLSKPPATRFGGCWWCGHYFNIGSMRTGVYAWVNQSFIQLLWHKQIKVGAGKWSEVAQSCLTLCDPMDCSPPDSSVPRIFQARYWSGLSFPSSGDLPNPGIEPGSPAL